MGVGRHRGQDRTSLDLCPGEKAKSHSAQLGFSLGNPTALAEADCLRAQAGKDASRGKEHRDRSPLVPPRTARKESACSATVSPVMDRQKDMVLPHSALGSVQKQGERGSGKSAALWEDDTASYRWQ